MKSFTYHRSLLAVILLLLYSDLRAQDVPLFTTDFTPAEFKARREKVYDAIGQGNVALLQGAPADRGYVRFRQTNEFYYLTGIEVPHAYILLDGSSRRASLYLPRQNPGREGSEGKLLSAEDAELLKKLSGIEQVYGIEVFSEHLFRYSNRAGVTLFTPFAPAEGLAMSRDLAVRANADALADPWDGTEAREVRLMNRIRLSYPGFTIKNLTPALDQLRLIKSAQEIALLRKATHLSGLSLLEAMRSTVPGTLESDLDAAAKYIYYLNGAQGDAYYSLIATASNAWYPHYHAGKGVMKDGDFLLMDYAPDVGYYMSDVTRMIPVNGRFNSWQRELYGFYLACYKAILNQIKAGLTAQAIKQAAASDMQKILASSKFSKPIYQKAAEQFVESYNRSAQSKTGMLGHWIGMATHDVGGYDGGPLRAGMIFTIEPALRVPEEKIYIRLEDVILITDSGAEILTANLPMEMDAIEKIMKEEGMLQKYPKQK